MSVADEIRKLQNKQSAEQRARAARASKRQAGRLEGQLKNNRAPGSLHDPGFISALDRKAREAKERAGEKRADLQTAIETARQKGHLPAAHDASTEYVPTAEEILGDQALPNRPVVGGGDVEELPDAVDVLNGGVIEAAGTPVEGSSFTREELDEIARMNPGPKRGVAQGKKKR